MDGLERAAAEYRSHKLQTDIASLERSLAVDKAARDRDAAAPTFSPAGLYFAGPRYPARWNLPEQTPGFDWLP